jgi:hypothetical protein
VAETEGGGGTGEPSVEELIEQIRGIDVGQFLLSTVSTLASLTYGKLDNGDLPGARLGIEALTALIPVLEGQIEAETTRDLQSAVANLQVAFTDAAGGSSAGGST